MLKPHHTPNAWFYPSSSIMAVPRSYEWIRTYVDGFKVKAS